MGFREGFLGESGRRGVCQVTVPLFSLLLPLLLFPMLLHPLLLPVVDVSHLQHQGIELGGPLEI